MTPASLVRFVVLASIWGGSFTFIRVAVRGMTPIQLNLTRLFIGMLVLLGYQLIRQVPMPRDPIIWAHISVAAVLGHALPFILLAVGEQHTPASIAGVLMGMTPLLTVGLAAAALPAERVTAAKLQGFFVGFAGLVLVVAPWRAEGSGTLWRQIVILGAAASYASGFVYVRRFLTTRGVPVVALATSQLIAAFLATAILASLVNASAPALSGSVVASVIGLGVISTGIGTVLYFRLIADEGPATASAVNYLAPVTAILIGVIALGESVSWNVIVGGLIVVLGVARGEGRLSVAAATGHD